MKYFITESYLKNYSPLNLNIDMNKINFTFKMIYDVNICELIGTYFADFLLQKHQDIANGTDNYNTYEEQLVDIIQNVMLWEVALSSIVELSHQITNSGIVNGFADNQNPSPTNMYSKKQDYYQGVLNSYITKLSNYLCKNKEHFNKYTDDLNNDSRIKNTCSCCNGSQNDIIDIGIVII